MILPISQIPQQETQLRRMSVNLDMSLLQTKEYQTLIDDMIATMYDDDGIGLAAPQIGKNIRLFVIGKDAVTDDLTMIEGNLKKRTDIAVINPTWEKISRKTIWETEGCLSVPDMLGDVKRYRDIMVSGYDRFGKPFRCEAHNFLARVIQHETDHINGILFIDKAKNIHHSNYRKRL